MICANKPKPALITKPEKKESIATNCVLEWLQRSLHVCGRHVWCRLVGHSELRGDRLHASQAAHTVLHNHAAQLGPNGCLGATQLLCLNVHALDDQLGASRCCCRGQTHRRHGELGEGVGDPHAEAVQVSARHTYSSTDTIACALIAATAVDMLMSPDRPFTGVLEVTFVGAGVCAPVATAPAAAAADCC
jgi:hypothetical protein